MVLKEPQQFVKLFIIAANVPSNSVTKHPSSLTESLPSITPAINYNPFHHRSQVYPCDTEYLDHCLFVPRG